MVSPLPPPYVATLRQWVRELRTPMPTRTRLPTPDLSTGPLRTLTTEVPIPGWLAEALYVTRELHFAYFGAFPRSTFGRTAPQVGALCRIRGCNFGVYMFTEHVRAAVDSNSHSWRLENSPRTHPSGALAAGTCVRVARRRCVDLHGQLFGRAARVGPGLQCTREGGGLAACVRSAVRPPAASRQLSPPAAA